MRIIKKRDSTDTIRRILDDDGKVLYVFGTVRDLLASDILLSCDAEPEMYAIGSFSDFSFRFYDSRQAMLFSVGYEK